MRAVRELVQENIDLCFGDVSVTLHDGTPLPVDVLTSASLEVSPDASLDPADRELAVLSELEAKFGEVSLSAEAEGSLRLPLSLHAFVSLVLASATEEAGVLPPMPTFTAAIRAVRARLPQIIEHLDSTDDAAWMLDVVRSADGSRNCFFGHLFDLGRSDEEGSWVWDAFEEVWATTYAIFPVNDGQHPGYQQATAKERCVAYLRALESGDELDTHASMEAEFLFHEGISHVE